MVEEHHRPARAASRPAATASAREVVAAAASADAVRLVRVATVSTRLPTDDDLAGARHGPTYLEPKPLAVVTAAPTTASSPTTNGVVLTGGLAVPADFTVCRVERRAGRTAWRPGWLAAHPVPARTSSALRRVEPEGTPVAVLVSPGAVIGESEPAPTAAVPEGPIPRNPVRLTAPTRAAVAALGLDDAVADEVAEELPVSSGACPS